MWQKLLHHSQRATKLQNKSGRAPGQKQESQFRWSGCRLLLSFKQRQSLKRKSEAFTRYLKGFLLYKSRLSKPSYIPDTAECSSCRAELPQACGADTSPSSGDTHFAGLSQRWNVYGLFFKWSISSPSPISFWSSFGSVWSFKYWMNHFPLRCFCSLSETSLIFEGEERSKNPQTFTC